MILYPAIDIKNGQCVRLYQGDFDKTTVYNSSPSNQAKIFEEHNFSWIHIIDLDGSLSGKSINTQIIKKIRQETTLKIQLGGGIRTLDNIKYWIDLGINHIIIGSMVFNDPHNLKKAINLYPKQIAIALDIKDNNIAIEGWTKTTNSKILDIMNEYDSLPIAKFICTDITRDGKLCGVNINLIEKLCTHSKIPVVASGGVQNKKDLEQLDKLSNLDGVITGKAIYEKTLSFADCQKFINHK